MRRAHLTSLFLLGLVAACGNDGGDGKTDAAPMIDAPADARIDGPPAPAMITISGQAVQRDGIGAPPPAVGVTIAAFRNSDEVNPIGMTTTDAQGMFALTVQTGGEAIDGFLKATKAGLVTTYLYPPTPIAADTPAPINMVTPTVFDLLATFAQVSQLPENGLIALIVVDGSTATSMPVAGATVTSNPAASAYRYSGANGLPNSTATATAVDGLAYLFNVRAGAVTVSGTKTGATFKTHGLTSHAGVLTTTLITP